MDGALGVSTSRTPKHRAADGRPTPSLSADAPELLALADGLRQAGRGVLQVNSDFGPGEFELLRQAAQHAHRPLTVLLLQMDREPDLWRRTLAQIHAARDAGIEATGQVGAKAIGVLMGLDASRHPFQDHPDWAPLADMTGAQAAAWLSAHPNVATRLVADDRPDTPANRALRRTLERSFVIDADFDYEPPMSAQPGRTRAARRHDGLEARARRIAAAQRHRTADAPVRELLGRQPGRRSRDAAGPGDRDGPGRRGGPRRADLRRGRPDVPAAPLGPRPASRPATAAGVPGAQADARHGARLRPGRPWPRCARHEGRPERHRLRDAGAAPAPGRATTCPRAASA